jgi:hypothetical protein
MEKLPTLSVDLVEALCKEFPQRCPSKTQTDREIWMYTGAADLVQHLKFLVEREKNESITGAQDYVHVKT